MSKLLSCVLVLLRGVIPCKETLGIMQSDASVL